jgi:hypothetical protein
MVDDNRFYHSIRAASIRASLDDSCEIKMIVFVNVIKDCFWTRNDLVDRVKGELIEIWSRAKVKNDVFEDDSREEAISKLTSWFILLLDKVGGPNWAEDHVIDFD